jgi:ribosomal protein L7Ae-like RNA K-turn-binding protein
MVDAHGKLPGRGVYVCLRRACLDLALRGTLLRQALRQEVVCAPLDEFVPKLVRTLEERAIACVHMARKAGRTVSGYARVMRALAQDPVTLLLMAEDTAPERRREYAMGCLRRQIPSHSFLVKTQLGALVGRDESSAIGILDRRLSERLRFYFEGMSRLMER